VRAGLQKKFGNVQNALSSLGFGPHVEYLPPSSLHHGLLGILGPASVHADEISDLLDVSAADGAGFISSRLFTTTLVPPDARHQRLQELNDADDEAARSARRVARYLSSIGDALSAREDSAREAESAHKAMEEMMDKQGRATGPRDRMQFRSGGGAFESSAGDDEMGLAPPGLQRETSYASTDPLHLEARRQWDIGELIVTSGGAALIKGGALVSSPGTHGTCITIAPRATVLMSGSGVHHFETTILRMDAPSGLALPSDAQNMAVPVEDRSLHPSASVGFAMPSFKGSVRKGGHLWIAGQRIGSPQPSKDFPFTSRPLQAGDVIGAVVDCDEGGIVFTVNGEIAVSCGKGKLANLRPVKPTDESQAPGADSHRPEQSVEMLLSLDGGVLPVVSVDGGTSMEVNLGASSLRFQPPTDLAGSIHREIELLREKRIVRAVGLAAGQPAEMSANGGSGLLNVRSDGTVWASSFLGVQSAELRGIALHRGRWYFEVDVLDPVALGLMTRAQFQQAEAAQESQKQSQVAAVQARMAASGGLDAGIPEAMIPPMIQVGLAVRDVPLAKQDPLVGSMRPRVFYGVSHPPEFGDRLRMYDLPLQYAHFPFLKLFAPSQYSKEFRQVFGHNPTDASIE